MCWTGTAAAADWSVCSLRHWRAHLAWSCNGSLYCVRNTYLLHSHHRTLTFTTAHHMRAGEGGQKGVWEGLLTAPAHSLPHTHTHIRTNAHTHKRIRVHTCKQTAIQSSCTFQTCTNMQTWCTLHITLTLIHLKSCNCSLCWLLCINICMHMHTHALAQFHSLNTFFQRSYTHTLQKPAFSYTLKETCNQPSK